MARAMAFVGMALGMLSTAVRAQTARNFAPELSASFLPLTHVARDGDKLIRAAEAGPATKPYMVIVTGPNCPACHHLKGSVNEGTLVRSLMDKFDVVYDKDASNWMFGSYMPEVNFFPAGKVGTPLPVTSGREGKPYSYTSDHALHAAMERALAANREEEAKKQALKEEMLQLYKEHKPEKMGSIERLWQKFEGKEEELLRLVSLSIENNMKRPGWTSEYTQTASDFAPELASKFLPSHQVSKAGNKLLRAAEAGPSTKPYMVIVTSPSCNACRHLKASVNEGTLVRSLMDKFDVVYDDHATTWKFHQYTPQVIFFPAGKTGTPLSVASDDKEFPYLFKNDAKLHTAMEQALGFAKAQGEDKATMKNELLALYKTHNPSKIGSVEKLWDKYAGKEEELLRLVRKKYGVKVDL